MQPTWLTSVVEDRLLVGLGEGEKRCVIETHVVERIKKFSRVYIIITV
jgi:hypothetical protein